MKVLVTGATGFVGRNLLVRLLKEGLYQEIFLPVRSLKKLEEQLRVEGLSVDHPQLRPLEMAAPDWDFYQLEVDHVIHCAGMLYGRNREEYFRTHVGGTENLLRTIAPPKKTILLSSQSAAGPCQPYQTSKQETDPDTPITWYGESKLVMEQRVAREFAHLPVAILRPPMILGARDTATLPLFKMVLGPIWFKPGMRKKSYSFLSVNDLVDAIVLLVRSPWEFKRETFFVAAEQPISDVELIQTAARVADRAGALVRVPELLISLASQVVERVPKWRNAVPSLTQDRAKEIAPNRWVVSTKSLEDLLGWRASGTLIESLQQAYQWYRARGELT